MTKLTLVLIHSAILVLEKLTAVDLRTQEQVTTMVFTILVLQEALKLRKVSQILFLAHYLVKS